MSVARQKVSVGVVDTLAVLNHVLILREFEGPSSDLGVVLLVVVQPQERAMISVDLEWMGSQVHSEVFTAPYHSVQLLLRGAPFLFSCVQRERKVGDRMITSTPIKLTEHCSDGHVRCITV